MKHEHHGPGRSSGSLEDVVHQEEGALVANGLSGISTIWDDELVCIPGPRPWDASR